MKVKILNIKVVVLILIILIFIVYLIISSYCVSRINNKDYELLSGIFNMTLPKSLVLVEKKCSYSRFSSRTSYLDYRLRVSKDDLDNILKSSGAETDYKYHVSFGCSFHLLKSFGISDDKLLDPKSWYFIGRNTCIYIESRELESTILVGIDPYGVGILKKNVFTDLFAI